MKQAFGLITPVSTLATRLKDAREHARLSQAELARRSRVSPGTIGNLEAGARRQPRQLLAIAGALGVSPEWLLSGRGTPTPQHEGVSPESREGRLFSGQAVSQDTDLIYPDILTWDQLVITELPSRFALVVRDNSMPPMMPGHTAVFSTTRTPKPGDVVLLRDGSGQYYVREFRHRTATSWQATARNSSFLSLDSEEHQLTILATQVGWSWD